MRKIMSLAAVVGGMFLTLALTALPALAKYPPQPPAEEDVIRGGGPGGAAVTGSGGVTGSGDIAFTGRDVTLLMALIAVLVIAGVVALIAARRRAAGAVG